MSKVLLLNEDQVRSLITMKDVVEACEKTFEGMGNDRVVNPTKINLDLGSGGNWPGYNAGMNAMPAYIGWQNAAGLKWIGGWFNNPAKGLPFIRAMILLVQPEDGTFLAAMDGAFITNMRTGAQAAVAFKHLSGKKEIVMGLYGAGAQGRTQTQAFAEVTRISELRVFDINQAAAEKFKADMEKLLPGRIRVCTDKKDAAMGCDAVVSVTHGKDKFIKNEWIKPGAVVFPLGSGTEASDELLASADKIVVDHVGQTLHRGALVDVVNRGLIGEKDLYGTIGEVVAGKKKGFETGKERIVCVAIGTGAMDVTSACVAYQRAKERGIGTEFAFTNN